MTHPPCGSAAVLLALFPAQEHLPVEQKTDIQSWETNSSKSIENVGFARISFLALLEDFVFKELRRSSSIRHACNCRI